MFESKLYPSYRLIIFQLFIFLGPIILLLINDIELLLKIPLALFCSISGYKTIRRYALLDRKESIIHIYKLNCATWQLVDKNGVLYHARLESSSICFLWLVLLNFYTVENKRYNLALFPDSLGKENFRRLRLVLLN